MQVLTRPEDMRNFSLASLRKNRSIGFVPTMGALHKGHLSLVEASREENDTTVTSIFINPIQFGPGEDLDKYPRDREGDLEKLERSGVEAVFIPESREIYPAGFGTLVEVPGLSEKLCGKVRPGHFRGVATVVTKLFNMVRPDRAYFGQKDYQQSLIIRQLAQDLDTGVEIVVCPTVRESDGLAMSSRNAYLSGRERTAATVLYRSMADIAGRISAIKNIESEFHRLLSSEPLVSEIQYASAYDPATLEGIHGPVGGRVLLAAAIKIGKTRLIDNMPVDAGTGKGNTC